jgi:hypothetical protein
LGGERSPARSWLSLVGSGLRQHIFAGLAEISEMVFHAGRYSSMTRLHAGTVLLDVGRAGFADGLSERIG